MSALLIDGSQKYSILCYGVFSPEMLDSAFEALSLIADSDGSQIYKFFGDGWPNGLILNEIHISNEADTSSIVSKALAQMFSAGPCLVALCMYDGAFGNYDDIFSSNVASQTYAFCFSVYEPVVVLDANLLSTQEWNLIMERSRFRLNERSRNKMGSDRNKMGSD